MTAVTLLALLIGGTVAYVSLAASLLAHGVGIGWIIAGAPVAYLLPAIVLTASWFTLTWIWRTPRPPEFRLGLAGSLRLYFNELFAVAASWPLVVLHRLLIRDPAPALVTTPEMRPIVLVHGVLINDGVWLPLRRYLMRAGAGPIYTINYGPPLGDIEQFAEQLAAKIDRVCADTGAQRVTLIGHSMGGLVSRAYLRRYGIEHVDRLITVGTPHHGSVLARGFPGTCMAQLRPGNAWLAELNGDEQGPAPVATTSIWSRHDSMVAPQASAELACADNIAVTGIGHNALLTDVSMHALIRGLVDGYVARADV